MNNKTIIKVGFRIIWRIMEISEGVILLDLHNCSDDTQPQSIIVILWIAACRNAVQDANAEHEARMELDSPSFARDLSCYFLTIHTRLCIA